MNDLLTIQDIAEMHRCSVRHARDVIVRLHGFPEEAPPSKRKKCWNAQEVHNFIHRKPLDAPGDFDLYRHFDKAGTLLYVGVSLSTVSRLSQHKRTAHWFSKIARVEVDRFPTREASLAAERQAIHSEHPLFNIQLAKNK